MEYASLPPLTKEDEAILRDSLKRCSTATIDAAINYRSSRDAELVPIIINGIIERFLEPEMRPKMQEGNDQLRFIEDLGIDSLTMMEIVMLVESILQVTIENEQLQELRTVGDVNQFINAKLGTGTSEKTNVQSFSQEDIEALLPHGEPYLFLDKANVNCEKANGFYKIHGEEFFLKGHFKDNPVFPAAIMLEALGQLAVLYLIKGKQPEEGKEIDHGKIFFTACENVRCQRICRPGDELELEMSLKRFRYPLAQFDGKITCGGDKVAIVENMSLTFDFKS